MSAWRERASAAHPIVTTYGRDPKAWARQIMHRFEGKDPQLLAVQIEFAKMAIGLIPFPADQK